MLRTVSITNIFRYFLVCVCVCFFLLSVLLLCHFCKLCSCFESRQENQPSFLERGLHNALIKSAVSPARLAYVGCSIMPKNARRENTKKKLERQKKKHEKHEPTYAQVYIVSSSPTVWPSANNYVRSNKTKLARA